MPRIFISHSSQNDDWAIALKDWLVREGWSSPDDLFLDLDPDRGIAAGQRWENAFRDAATRCEAVLFLVSEQWISSKWCFDEYQLGHKLNKKLFALTIDNVQLDRLPSGLTTQWQIVRLRGEPAERFLTVHPITGIQSPIHIAEAGLKSLRRGLEKAGIGTASFELQPDQNEPTGWRAPYRGLEALEPEDAAVFLGRDADIVRGIDMLRGLATQKAPRLLAILGASGAGKSSFLRAGLWPRLLRDDAQWLPLRVVRAGRGGAIEGSEGLLAALEDIHNRFAIRATRADLRDRLSTPETFVSLLLELRQVAAKRALLTNPPYPLPVLCLDQGEEVFVGGPATENERFLGLARAAMAADAALFVVSIRSDSYGAMQGANALAGIDQAALTLGPVPPGEIARVIREPAEILRRKAGPVAPLFDVAVIERLQQEVHGEADALPLLAFVLQRLMREYQGLPVIGVAELERTGGVSAAIESAAEAALDDANILRDRSRERDVLRRLFIPRLARIDRDSKAPQRRVARQGELPADLGSLAEALTRRRLLVVKAAASLDSGATDSSTFEVAHEALLRRWPTLAELLAEDRDALLLLDGVLSAAADWARSEAARKPDFLAHRGSRLHDAQALGARGPDWEREILPARDYLAACAAREAEENRAKEAALVREQTQIARTKKLQKRVSLALSAVFVAALITAALACWQYYSGSKSEAAAFASLSKTAYDQGFCDRAVRLAVAGLPPLRGASPLSYLSKELQGDLAIYGSPLNCPYRLGVTGHYAAFSPDGSRIATASHGPVRIWDAKTGGILATMPGADIVAFSPDGSRVVTAAMLDNAAHVWEAKTGAELVKLSGHTGGVTAAAFSPDGTRALTASSDNTARVWDAATGAELAKLSGHTAYINTAAFSPDGSRIVTASYDKTARVWDATTGTELIKISAHTQQVRTAAFSLDGGRFVTASDDGTAQVWDGKTGVHLVTLDGQGRYIWNAAFSPDGHSILTASEDDIARLWDAATGSELGKMSAHTGLRTAAFSPDGSRVVTASDDQTAEVWDAKTGTLQLTLSGHEPGALTLFDRTRVTASFSPDGRSVVTASQDQTVRLWDVAGDAATRLLTGHVGWVRSAAFSPDGARIVTASMDRHAAIWDIDSGRWLVLKGHTDAVLSASFSADGRRVVTASVDKTARVWNAETGAELAKMASHAGEVNAASFSPDGRRIVTASKDKTARVWDTETGAELLELSGHDDSVNTAAFSPDGNRIVTASQDKTARVWDVSTGATLFVLSGHADWVLHAEFSSDGSRIFTRSRDQTIRLWDARTGAELVRIDVPGNILSAALSKDGNRVVTGANDNVLRIWDAKTGALLRTMSGYAGMAAITPISVDFSPDGRHVVSGGVKTVTLWDVESGNALATQVAHTTLIERVTFSPDGARVASASWDNTARIWKLDPLVVMSPDKRQEYVCRERLIGLQSFSTMEMQSSILRGRDDLRNPCDRPGPLSPEYYWRAATRVVEAIEKKFEREKAEQSKD